MIKLNNLYMIIKDAFTKEIICRRDAFSAIGITDIDGINHFWMIVDGREYPIEVDTYYKLEESIRSGVDD